MKVVFLEEVEGTASPGDIKNVAAGFARNYLLPRKLAAPATDHYINIAKAKATKHARRQDRLDDESPPTKKTTAKATGIGEPLGGAVEAEVRKADPVPAEVETGTEEAPAEAAP